jgi:arsenate reductase
MAAKVLFLCTRNACRSQLAEALMRQRFGERLEVHSAGVQPGRIHPLTLRVLREVGIDATGQRSKHVDELRDIRFDLVVTLCDSAAQTCPVFPGTTRLVHRDYRNPEEARGSEEERLAVFRQVRDQLARELPRLIEEELGVTPPKPAAPPA